MGTSKNHSIKLWIVAVIVAMILGIILWNDSIILRYTYDRNKPVESNHSVNEELVSAYRNASREAVEEYFGESVTDDYIYCYAQALDGGLVYYCIIDGTAYRFTIYAGSAMDVYTYILYDAYEAPDPGIDTFDFVLEEGLIGGIMFASIQDA